MADVKKDEQAKAQAMQPTKEEATITFTMAELGDFVAKQVATTLASQSMAPQLYERTAKVSFEGQTICTECGQFLERGCKGKHVDMVVYPSSDVFAQYFPGIAINHKRYMSSGPDHKIKVPAEAAGEMSRILANFEREEVRMLTGINRESRTPLASIGENSDVQNMRRQPVYR